MTDRARVGWKTVALGDVCTIDKTKHDGAPAPYVGLDDISKDMGEFIGSHEPVSVKSATFSFDERHILYGRLRSYLNKALKPDFSGHYSTEIFPLRPSDSLDRRYLFHWLTSDPIFKRIDEISTGIRMPRANMNEVIHFEIPLPPLDEQRRIVALLDKAFEALDRARANAEANLRDSEKLFKSTLHRTFNDNAIEWTEMDLVNLGVIRTGSTPKTTDPDNFGDFIPFIKPGDFRDDGSLIYDKQGLSEKGASLSRIVPSGSALMVCIGTIGKAGFTDRNVVTNQQINSISPYEGISGEYLYHQMITQEFLR